MSRRAKYYLPIRNLLYRTNRMILTGLFKRPAWYNAVRRNPPTVALESPHPGQIIFPYDKLQDRIVSLIPELEHEIIDELHPDIEPLQVLISKRWYEYMDREKMNELAALDRAKKDYQIELDKIRESMNYVRGDIMPINQYNIDSVLTTRFNEMSIMRSNLRKQGAKPQPARFSEIIEEKINTKLGIAAGHSPIYNYNNTEQAQHEKSAIEQLDKEIEQIEQQYRSLKGATLKDKLTDQQLANNYREAFINKIDYTDNEIAALAYQQGTDIATIKLQIESLKSSNQYKQSLLQSQKPKTLAEKIAIEEQTETLHYILERINIHPTAKFRDFIAALLRIQILELKQKQLIPLVNYTQSIDKWLWHRAVSILQSERIDNLTIMKDNGNRVMLNCKELIDKHTEILLQKQQQSSQSNQSKQKSNTEQLSKSQLLELYGIIDGQYAVYSTTGLPNVDSIPARLSTVEISKHQLLMKYIDEALDTVEYSNNNNNSIDINTTNQQQQLLVKSIPPAAGSDTFTERCKSVLTSLSNAAAANGGDIESVVDQYLNAPTLPIQSGAINRNNINNPITAAEGNDIDAYLRSNNSTALESGFPYDPDIHSLLPNRSAESISNTELAHLNEFERQLLRETTSYKPPTKHTFKDAAESLKLNNNNNNPIQYKQ